jgi:hypothetical protein
MRSRPLLSEEPDRFYVVTGGRSHVPDSTLDLVSLIVRRRPPTPGMQSEHASILRMCHQPMSVAELSSHLGLPVNVTRILLCDLLDMGHVRAHDPSIVDSAVSTVDRGVLQQVLVGLQRL